MNGKQARIQDLMRTAVKKPTPGGNGQDISLAPQEEIEERLRKTAILEKLGINISNFDGDDGHEDADVLNAVILVRNCRKINDATCAGYFFEYV